MQNKYEKKVLDFLKENQEESGLTGFNDVELDHVSKDGFEVYAVCWSGKGKAPVLGLPIYIASNGEFTDFNSILGK